MDDLPTRQAIAAAFGSLLYALGFAQGTWQSRAVLLFSGCGFAQWLGPAIAEKIGLRTEEELLGFAFLCGFLGDKSLSLVGSAAERFIRSRFVTLLQKK